MYILRSEWGNTKFSFMYILTCEWGNTKFSYKFVLRSQWGKTKFSYKFILKSEWGNTKFSYMFILRSKWGNPKFSSKFISFLYFEFFSREVLISPVTLIMTTAVFSMSVPMTIFLVPVFMLTFMTSFSERIQM